MQLSGRLIIWLPQCGNGISALVVLPSFDTLNEFFALKV